MTEHTNRSNGFVDLPNCMDYCRIVADAVVAAGGGAVAAAAGDAVAVVATVAVDAAAAEID